MDTDRSTQPRNGLDFIHRDVEGVSLPVRLYANTHLHRLVPTRVAFALARQRGRWRARLRPARRETARTMMRALLEHTPRAHEADALAVRWLEEKAITTEMFWRPWISERATVDGVEHWHAAQAMGRGVVLALGHIMPGFVMYAALPRHGLDFFVITSTHYWDPKPPGYMGLEILRWLKYGEDNFSMDRYIASEPGAAERALELLAAGETVAAAFDVPGSKPTPFLGRTVRLSAGPAALAWRSGAPILPVTCRRVGTRAKVVFDPPIDPVVLGDRMAVREAVAAVFEAHILARPETIHHAWDPLPLVVDAEPRRALA